MGKHERDAVQGVEGSEDGEKRGGGEHEKFSRGKGGGVKGGEERKG